VRNYIVLSTHNFAINAYSKRSDIKCKNQDITYNSPLNVVFISSLKHRISKFTHNETPSIVQQCALTPKFTFAFILSSM